MWLNAPELSKAQIDSKRAFERFALQMLSKLIPAEEFITHQRFGMRIFIRLDASAFLANGELQFIVNELTHSHNTDMFNYWDFSFKNELLVQELAKLFVLSQPRTMLNAEPNDHYKLVPFGSLPYILIVLIEVILIVNLLCIIYSMK